MNPFGTSSAKSVINKDILDEKNLIQQIYKTNKIKKIKTLFTDMVSKDRVEFLDCGLHS